MRIKRKIKNFVQGLSVTVRLHPAEAVMAVLYCILACLNYRFDFSEPAVNTLLIYFPVSFLFTYLVNGIVRGSRWWPLYYLSALVGLLLLGRAFETDVYLISLIVVQLLLLIRNGSNDNAAFVEYALRYASALLSAVVISVIAWLLVLSVYFSVRYIFDVWSEDTVERFMVYSAFAIYMVLTPLLFLTFGPRRTEGAVEPSRSFDILINYILVPVLLAYAVILYMYLAKIAVSVSLPKGGVAYIVAGFVAYAYLLQGLQVFLSRRYYDWFFKRVSLIVLPTLILYWVGACYRIHQYGFTEPRVYLVLIGWILTATALLFFSKRTGRYLYVACIAVCSVSLITYIPGWTAGDIEEWSQRGRELEDRVVVEEEVAERYLTVENDTVVDIAGFDRLEVVRGYSDNGLWSDFNDDILRLYRGDKELAAVDMRQFLQDRLQKAGVDLGDSIPRSIYPDLLRIKVDSGMLQLESIVLRRADSLYSVDRVRSGYLLSGRERSDH